MQQVQVISLYMNNFDKCYNLIIFKCFNKLCRREYTMAGSPLVEPMMAHICEMASTLSSCKKEKIMKNERKTMT